MMRGLVVLISMKSIVMSYLSYMAASAKALIKNIVIITIIPKRTLNDDDLDISMAVNRFDYDIHCKDEISQQKVA